MAPCNKAVFLAVMTMLLVSAAFGQEEGRRISAASLVPDSEQSFTPGSKQAGAAISTMDHQNRDRVKKHIEVLPVPLTYSPLAYPYVYKAAFPFSYAAQIYYPEYDDGRYYPGKYERIYAKTSLYPPYAGSETRYIY